MISSFGSSLQLPSIVMTFLKRFMISLIPGAIRNDPNLIPVIYAIGLGGTSAEPIDATFMERVSNDPRSPIYNSAKPAGEYFYSPTATDLGGVFQQVASEILRISQ